jgi:hypothetical protein
MADEIRNTPRNALWGFGADAVNALNRGLRNINSDGYNGAGIANLLGLSDVVDTLDRKSYGAPLTTGRGMTTAVRPEALNALMAAAPVVAKFPKQAAGLAALAMGDTGAAGKAIFAGTWARNADMAAHEKAIGMLDAGVPNRDVHAATGWFKGPDGKLRFEIDDSGARFNTSVRNGENVENDLTHGMGDFNYGQAFGNGALLEHPELGAAYGGQNVAPSTFVRNGSLLGQMRGAFNGSDGSVTMFAPAKAQDARSTLLHEIQHAVQQREGFASGGMPQLSDPNGIEAYKRLAGEAEARAVQSRMNMTPEQRRASFPLDSYDVPLNQLIFR